MRRELFLATIILTPSLAVAQQADPAAATRGITPFILAALIAYVTRRMAIGGWLFYFYMGLIFSPMLAIVLAYPVLGDYLQPSLWHSSREYWISFLSYLPWLISLIMVFIFSVRLIFKSQRNKANIMLLRYSLVALVLTRLVGLSIDFMYFPEEVIPSVLATVWAIIVCLYFFSSKRVKYVFDNWSGEWKYDDFINSLSTRLSAR